jgi:hypothetical protein
MITGGRKYTFGLIACFAFSILVGLLGLNGIDAGADPTSLGIMFGGIASGYGAIMSAFVWGNAKEWSAKLSGGELSVGKQ